MKKYLLPLILILILAFGANCFAIPWEVDTAVYSEKFKDVGDEDATPLGVTFSADGTKMYMVGATNDKVYQYTLSIPWDVSSAEYASKFKDVGDEDTTPFSVTFSADGTKMYIMGTTNDMVFQYTLSTPWDVSSATYNDKLYWVGIQDTTPYGVAFKPDGTKMYMVGTDTTTVFQYTVSSAWDVSSAEYASKFKDVGDEDAFPYDVIFSADGTKMYIAGIANHTVFQYTLSTPWDVSSAEYASKFKDVGDEDFSPYGVTFNADGTKMYMVGLGTTTVYQYTLPAVGNALFFAANF